MHHHAGSVGPVGGGSQLSDRVIIEVQSTGGIPPGGVEGTDADCRIEPSFAGQAVQRIMIVADQPPGRIVSSR